MRALILGGTGFLGRAIVDACVSRGHSVTLFHRGRTMPGSFPGVEHVLGDRSVSLDPLRDRSFDVIFDPSGYEVAPVRAAARLSPSLYVFVSSISVYSDPSRMEESGPVQELDDAENAPLSLDKYGALKAACERALEEILPGFVLNVRAGLILGPHDYDDRFPWLLRRIARGGTVIAPGDPVAIAQAIDVRDLASWIVSSAERKLSGTFNTTGPAMPMLELFETIRSVTASDAKFVWVPDELLLKHEVKPYSEMPFWLPASLGAKPVSIDRAVAEGLQHRPFLETAADTWHWLQSGFDQDASVRANRRLEIPAGITAEREALILREHGT